MSKVLQMIVMLHCASFTHAAKTAKTATGAIVVNEVVLMSVNLQILYTSS